ncbi:hypothetical protein ASL14_13735 [Paenibacillus sp. IHB B 3084]|uniref:hypothetical protein n=1 Tax=Paenibacillus TaxID=44249 RepID=UPI000722631A|nr:MULTISPECIES: hypothetical protein [Paenibacillus]ALP37078.1 hypothetical protein ASL14_13735 [Paenibacillus sp. IHB B 3084]MBE0337816.1 hypothetical protein [Paenibacillus sp. 23TSA30-6]
MTARTIEELEQIRKECRSMVTKRAAASGGAVLVPVPGADVLADVGILMQLLPAINGKFGLSEKQLNGLDAETKSMVYGFITSIGSKLIGRIITREVIVQILQKMGVRIATKQVSKFVPLLGQGLAAAIGFTAMRTIGNRHVEQCYEVAKRLLEQQASADIARNWTVPQQPLDPAGIELLPGRNLEAAIPLLPASDKDQEPKS